jgi:hypothetical protein
MRGAAGGGGGSAAAAAARGAGCGRRRSRLTGLAASHSVSLEKTEKPHVPMLAELQHARRGKREGAESEGLQRPR